MQWVAQKPAPPHLINRNDAPRSKEFHDQLLSYGSPPVRLEAMLGE